MMSAIGSVLTYILNVILITFSSTAVAVYGCYFKVQSFIFMPIFGLNSGMVPVVAYNYGAGNKERIHQTVKFAMISAVAIMLCGLVVFNVFPAQLLGMFNASADMLEIGVPAFKTISLAFVSAGVCIICGSTCQAFGYATYSLITSAARQLVVLLPAIYLLSLTGNINNIWYAWPIAEVVSLTMSVLLLRRVFNKTGMSLKKA
jgi:Na+-driven multidrug efflux pump